MPHLVGHQSERAIWAVFTFVNSLVIFGLQHDPSAMNGTVDIRRVLAAALSLALTGAFMIAFKAVQAIVINRHAGIDNPRWALREHIHSSG